MLGGEFEENMIGLKDEGKDKSRINIHSDKAALEVTLFNNLNLTCCLRVSLKRKCLLQRKTNSFLEIKTKALLIAPFLMINFYES